MLELAADLADASATVARRSPSSRSRGSRDRRPAPLRQGRRSVLRPDLGACTRPCAAPIRTRRCTGSRACSMAAAIRTTSRAASCAWPSRTSASPIRAAQQHDARCLGGLRPARQPRRRARARQRAWCISPSRRRATRCTWRYGEAKADVEQFGTLDVPLRFRNAPTKLMKELGYGKGYRYAHDEPGCLRDRRALPAR